MIHIVVMLGVSLAGGFVTWAALAFLTRNQQELAAADKRPALAKAWMAFVLLVLIDVLFVVFRGIGLTAIGRQTDLHIVFEGFWNWVAFTTGICIAYYLDEKRG